MQIPLISVIIPTINEEKHLPILLAQFKKQTFKNYEIIVSDGGSKDKTIEIARNFGCIITKGGTVAEGRNGGAKIAKGDLLLFTDADNTFFSEDFLEKAVREFEKRNLGVASFPIFPNGNWIDKFLYSLYNFWTKLSQGFLPHATNTILVKKEVFEKVGGFDKEITIGEDHDFARRAGKISKFGFIETKPIITSARRIEREGRLKLYTKYLLAGIYTILFGPPKKDFFHYWLERKEKEK